MSNKDDSNYVSVGSWMWMMFVTVIPIIGFIMMIVWCFTGENESRKNYFRAIWAWIFSEAGSLASPWSAPGSPWSPGCSCSGSPNSSCKND